MRVVVSILPPHPSIRRWQVAESPSTPVPPSPALLPPPCLFLRSIKQTVPRHFPWISCSGVWSDTTWPLETVWIFQASATLWRAGVYLQGCGCRARAITQSHIDTMFSLKLAGGLGSLVGITCSCIDSVTTVFGFTGLLSVEIWLDWIRQCLEIIQCESYRLKLNWPTNKIWPVPFEHVYRAVKGKSPEPVIWTLYYPVSSELKYLVDTLVTLCISIAAYSHRLANIPALYTGFVFHWQRALLCDFDWL